MVEVLFYLSQRILICSNFVLFFALLVTPTLDAIKSFTFNQLWCWNVTCNSSDLQWPERAAFSEDQINQALCTRIDTKSLLWPRTLTDHKEPGLPLFSTLVNLHLHPKSQGRLFLVVLPSNMEGGKIKKKKRYIVFKVFKGSESHLNSF